MLNIFQYHVLWSIKVHEPDYDFIIDHNFYQYQMTLFVLFNALCLCLSMFHIVFFFLLVLIFLIYLCSRFNGEDSTMSFWDGLSRVLCLLFAPVPFLWQYKHVLEVWVRWKSYSNSPFCSDSLLWVEQRTHGLRPLAEDIPEPLSLVFEKSQSSKCSWRWVRGVHHSTFQNGWGMTYQHLFPPCKVRRWIITYVVCI